jgi:hypothetical protein
MEGLIRISETLAFKTSRYVKNKRIEDIFNLAIKCLEGKQGAAVLLRKNVQMDSEDIFSDMKNSIERISMLCQMGHSIAVLAKVEAMHVGMYSDALCEIGEEVSTYVNNIEESLLSAYDSATGKRLAA